MADFSSNIKSLKRLGFVVVVDLNSFLVVIN